MGKSYRKIGGEGVKADERKQKNRAERKEVKKHLDSGEIEHEDLTNRDKIFHKRWQE
jgi:hypothetical protein